MYLNHFGLAEEPFSVTSDPRFLFLSDSHEEALAHLSYCVEYRKGFAAITGEIGTGKTTLLNTLVSRLDQHHSIAFVYQSANSTIELMRYVFKDLGIQSDCQDRTEYLNRFNDYLLSEMSAGREVVLVVDEAQNLSVEVLEDLRLISNFESANRKLVQIVLAGQTELGHKLRLPELRQLNQRIAIQYVLQPLGADETEAYIQHRLKTAGASRVDIFHPKAIKGIYAISGGVPRLINQLCDTAMLRAFAKKKQVINAQNVQDVVREDFQFRSQLSEPKSLPTRQRVSSRVLAVAALALIALAVAIWWGVGPGLKAGPTKVLPDNELRAELDSTKNEIARLHSELASMRQTEAQERASGLAVTAKEVSSLPVSEVERPLVQRHVQQQMLSASASEHYQVRPGDRLTGILEAKYGFASWGLVSHVLECNPRISDPNLIFVGQLIELPVLSDSLANVLMRNVER